MLVKKVVLLASDIYHAHHSYNDVTELSPCFRVTLGLDKLQLSQASCTPEARLKQQNFGFSCENVELYDSCMSSPC